MAYRVKNNVPREQLIAAIDALNPFYGFGAVLSTANDDGGQAHVTLYAGKPMNVRENPHGVKIADIDQPEEYENEITLDTIDPEGCLLTVVGTWSKVPASFMGPVLKASDFFAARDAFMACVEEYEVTGGSGEPRIENAK